MTALAQQQTNTMFQFFIQAAIGFLIMILVYASIKIVQGVFIAKEMRETKPKQ